MYQLWTTVDGKENFVLGEGEGALEAVADGRANAHRLMEKGHNVDLATTAQLWRVGDHRPIPGEEVLLNPPTEIRPPLQYEHHRAMAARDGRSGRMREALEELVHRTRARALQL